MKHVFEWVKRDDLEGLRYSLRCVLCKWVFHEVGFTATAQATAMKPGWIEEELDRSLARTIQEVGDQECSA